MNLEREVARRGGVAPTSQILALGFSPYHVSRSVRAGALIRPRNGWIAIPRTDPQLLFAARHGVVLSCVTQAKRLGLWVLEEGRHVAAPKRGRRIRTPEDVVVHWRRPLIPRAPETLADRIENVLDNVAACLPHDEALAIWDSALQKGLSDYAALASLPLRGAAAVLLQECTPFADSGLETFFRTRLSWLRLRIRAQVWVHGHRVDFLIGDRLVVQIDGGSHVGSQRTQDIRHDAALSHRGYLVIRVGYAQVVHEWPSVQDEILDAIARGRHLAS